MIEHHFPLFEEYEYEYEFEYEVSHKAKLVDQYR